MKKHAALTLLIALSLSLSACAGEPAETPTAVLQEIGTGVQIRPSPGAAFVPAESGQALLPGGALQTGPADTARLLIQPGEAWVTVGPDTLFVLSGLESASTRLQLQRGTLRVASTEVRLAVETSSGSVSVEAGVMGVSLSSGSSSVACLEGSCEVSLEGQAGSLPAGEACDLAAGCEARPLSQAESQAWAGEISQVEPFLPTLGTVESPPAATLEASLTPTRPASTETPVPTGTPLPPAAATQPPPAASITVDGTWGHVTRTPTIAAFYMVIHNHGAGDALVGAASPSCGSTGMQIMGIGPDGNDLSLYVALPTGGVVTLQFQGTRILCYNMAGGIGPGSTVQLTLHFQNAGDLTISIPIQDPPEG
jgi:copper(I)-binding protein